MVGKVLGGRYEILELIGVGGMSKVYKARCKLLNRFVAVKILKDEFKADKKFIELFYTESRAAASLSSPNIVSIHDVGEEDDIYYIVMEYVEGVTLKEVIKENGIIAWNVALNFTLQILNALECAHRNGIVHRDIKPQNVIVTNEGVLKVTDFGIARAVNGNDTKIMEESVVGSVHYISPEQAKRIMIDARSDLYSLGVVMYEMLTGRLPYEASDPISVTLMHLSSEPLSIKDLNISVPNELVRIATKAMQRDVIYRYQSAKEMAADLNEFKKAENLTTKENEEAFLKETIAMVQIAKKGKEPVSPAQENKEEDKPSPNGGTMPYGKNGGGRIDPAPDDKKKRNAVIAAIGASTVIVLLMVFLFVKIFFPSFHFTSLFESKEYLLPNVVDQYISEVQPMLEAEGLKVKVNEIEDDSREDGIIVSQYPSGNIMVKVRRTTVHLDVVKNNADGSVIAVPKVVNKEYRQAQQELEKAGFKVKVVEEASEDVPAGYVVRQNPSANQSAEKGTQVVIYVSQEAEKTDVFVPDFIGMTREEAINKAEKLGLSVSFTEKAGAGNHGKVLEQNIPKNTLISKNNAIQLTIAAEESSSEPNPPSPTAAPSVESTQTLTIDLPQDRETVTVVVKKDGSEVYRKQHNTSENRITVSVKGSGTQKVEITLDGQQFYSQNIKFN